MTTSMQVLTQLPHRRWSGVSSCASWQGWVRFHEEPLYPGVGHINTSSAATDNRAHAATIGAGRIANEPQSDVAKSTIAECLIVLDGHCQ